MFYEEKVAVSEKDRKKIFVRIVATFAGAYLLSCAYAALKLPFGGIARLVFIAIAVAGIYFAFRHGIIEYIYRIEDDKLLFIINSGKFDKVLCAVPVERVSYITKGGAPDVEGVCLNAVKTSEGEERYTCVYTDEGGKVCKLMFEPSEAYLEKVKERGVEIR